MVIVRDMASGTNTSTSKIATIIVVIPIVIAAWFAAPWFLPVWRWQNIDWEALARDHSNNGYTMKALKQEFQFVVAYKPRGGRGANDPVPFQIITSSPAWKSVHPQAEDENELRVRCSVISEFDGEPISKLWIGTRDDEAIFKITGWRFPPGSFGKPKGRPVIVFQGFSLEKLELSQAINLVNTSRLWENDDEWEERDDGFTP